MSSINGERSVWLVFQCWRDPANINDAARVREILLAVFASEVPARTMMASLRADVEMFYRLQEWLVHP